MFVSPHDHRCTVETIDYANVALGHLRCETCGRAWVLKPDGWKPTPLTKRFP